MGEAPGTLFSTRLVLSPNLVRESYISDIIFLVPLMSMLFILSMRNRMSALARALMDQ